MCVCCRGAALSWGGFVDTAVRMHDGVLDEVDVGSGRIMELRDGGEGWRGSVRKGAGGAR